MNQQGVVIQHCGKPRVPPIPLLKGWHDFTFIPHIPYPQTPGDSAREYNHRRHVFRFRVFHLRKVLISVITGPNNEQRSRACRTIKSVQFEVITMIESLGGTRPRILSWLSLRTARFWYWLGPGESWAGNASLKDWEGRLHALYPLRVPGPL